MFNADKSLPDKAGVLPDDCVTDLGEGFIVAAGKRFFDRKPKGRSLA
jgi:catalase